MTLNHTQRISLAAIAILMLLDAIITLDGAWNHNATFFEANPLLASFSTINEFTAAVILLKTAAIVLVVLAIQKLNHLGDEWGDMAAYGGLFTCTLPIALLLFLNAWR